MIKLRKKSEVEEIINERREKFALKKASQDTWHKHWENEGVKVVKRLGGGKRPKTLKDLDLAPQADRL